MDSSTSALALVTGVASFADVGQVVCDLLMRFADDGRDQLPLGARATTDGADATAGQGAR